MKEYEVDIRKLANLSIYQLREVGAKVGVRNPTTLRSAELRKCICDVVTGKVKPYLKSKSGRPHKEIISDADWDALVGFDNSFEFGGRDDMLSLYSTSSCLYPDDENEIYTGYVMQIHGEFIMAVGTPGQIKLNRYARINRNTANYRLLRIGDIITATLSTIDKVTTDPYVTEIKSINGYTDFDAIAKGLPRASHTEVRQSEQKMLALKNQQFLFKYPQLQFLNNDYPVKLGQRALFLGEDKMAGQDFLANSIAKDASREYHIIHFSCNKMPEDKIQSYDTNVEYFFSTFDVTPRDLVFTFEIAVERAKKLSQHMHTVIIIDDIYDVMNAYVSLFESKRPDDKDIPYTSIWQQLKSLFASTGIYANGSLSLFAFCSTPRETVFADYVHMLDSLANSHFVLDKAAFVSGKEDYLVHDRCYINTPKRSIV